MKSLGEHGIKLLALLTAVAAWSSLRRYSVPEGEKYFEAMPPGASDFNTIFDGTMALREGKNPYFDVPQYPWHPYDDQINGVRYHTAYQPSHFVLYLPLSWVTTDRAALARFVLVCNEALLGLLALVVCQLAARISGANDDAGGVTLLALVLFAILSTTVGNTLGLERGQSDIFNAALCWCGLLLFLDGKRFWPAVFITSAILVKGYGVLLGAGLAATAVRERRWKTFLAGIGCAAVLLLLPVTRYLREGITATLGHANVLFDMLPINASFRRFFCAITPSLAQPGRLMATVGGTLLAIGYLRESWHARDRGDAPAAAFWLVGFATGATGTVVGFSSLSYVYNQVLYLPGFLLLVCTIPRWASAARLTRPAWALGVVGVLLLQVVPIATASAGLIGLLLLLAIVWQRARSGAPVR
jgi:hypothetical protein